MYKIPMQLVLFALLFSSATLLLLESQLKYMLFIFEVALILIVWLFLTEHDASGRPEANGRTKKKIDLIFLAQSILVFALCASGSNNALGLLCSVLLSYFLPGYVLLRLLKFNSLSSWIEWPVLAFASSFGLTSVILIAFLPFDEHRAILISAAYLVISLLPILKDWIDKSGQESGLYRNSEATSHNRFDGVLLLWISLFFLFVILSLYPQMSYIPGLDIDDLLATSIRLLQAPETYQSVYPLFHLPIGTIYQLSSPQMETFQTILAFLSIMIVFSFYIMAKGFLARVDRRAPVLATVFFFLFSGFGWLYFLAAKVIASGAVQQFDILAYVNEVSYWDVGYGNGSWTWFWFRPMTVGFALLFALLYLLVRKDLPKRTYVALFSFLVVTLNLVHVPEAIFFVVFLLVLTFVRPKKLDLRLKEASLASTIGNIAYYSFAWLSTNIGGPILSPSTPIALVVVGSAGLSYFVNRVSSSPPLGLAYDHQVKLSRLLSGIITILFAAGLLSWLCFPTSFSASYVSEIYYIPLMLYPVLLGVTGFLAINGLVVVAKEGNRSRAMVFLLLFLFALLFGKLLSFVNMSFIDLGYHEKRYLPILAASVAALASVSLIKRIPSSLPNRKRVVCFATLALLVTGGAMSTNLSIEFWKLGAERSSISSYTLDAVKYLSSPGNMDVRTPILTFSPLARAVAQYIPTLYVVDRYRYPLWESRYPETALLILYSDQHPPPYLFLYSQDIAQITSNRLDGYFGRHFYNLLAGKYSNPEITILAVPGGVPPSPHGKSVLLVPEDESDDYLFVCDMLSLGGYNFTTCLNSDTRTIMDAEFLIIPRDDEHYNALIENLRSQPEYQLTNRSIIIFNTNGYGPWSNLFFEFGSGDLQAEYIRGPTSILDLPVEVSAPQLTAKNDTRLLAWYSNGTEETPITAESTRNSEKLLYVNVYPIIEAGLKEETVSDARKTMDLIMAEYRNGWVRDVSGNGNNGSVHGTVIDVSNLGISQRLDGEASYIEVAHSDSLNPTSITIEAWVTLRNSDTSFAIIDKKSVYNSSDGYSFLFGGDGFLLNFGNGTVSLPNALRYGHLNVGLWYHLAVTYDGQEVTYFVNGADVGSVRQNESIAGNSNTLMIGRTHDGGWKLNGSIYSITVYNEALNRTEIEESYKRTASRLWKMNPISRILGDVIQVGGLSLQTGARYETWVYKGDTAFFKEATLQGHVVLNSPSFMGFKIDGLANITLDTDREHVSVDSVTKIYINRTDCLEVYSPWAEISEGKGFYTGFTLVNPTLFLSGNNTIVTMITSDNSSRVANFSIGEIALSGKLALYARTPSIEVSGEAAFEGMYSLFSLYPTLRSSGHNLTISGSVRFDIVVSDKYKFASNLRWSGIAIRNPPILIWSEYESLQRMLPFLLISTAGFVFLKYLQRKRDLLNSRESGCPD